MRPGEKLLESLNAADEYPAPTEHEHIVKIEGGEVNADWLDEGIVRLQAMTNNGAPLDEVAKTLRELANTPVSIT